MWLIHQMGNAVASITIKEDVASLREPDNIFKGQQIPSKTKKQVVSGKEEGHEQSREGHSKGDKGHEQPICQKG